MKILADSLAQAFRTAGVPEELAVVTRSDRPDLADYQCNGAMAAAKQLGRPPIQIAQLIRLAFNDPRFTVSVAGPGFLNIRVDDTFLANMIKPPRRGKRKGELKILDFGGPNVAKAMHVGHLRSLVIGKSLREILVYMGYEVITDIHWGDWGYQMGLVLAALMSDGFQAQDGDNYSIEHLQDIYPRAAAYAKDNEEFNHDAHDLTRRLQFQEPQLVEMWTKVVQATQASVMKDLRTLGVEFDLYNGESDAAQILLQLHRTLDERGLLQTSDGAAIIPCSDPVLPPLIFQNSAGGYLYGATDLATIMERAKANPEEIIYIVDQRQELHFRQVFDVAGQLGYGLRLCHAGFGTVQGPDGKPLKTRAGGVPKLRDMLDEAIEKALVKNPDSEVARKIAIAAIKFNDLQNKRHTNYAYDIDKALAHEGKTGPYLLYQLVRMKRILEVQDVGVGSVEIHHDDDRQLVLEMLAFGDVLDKVEQQLSPHILADYLYGLAQKFSAYYGKHEIKSSPYRLAIIYYLEAYLSLGIELLGIEEVEAM